jgi:hypothetical protein
MVTRGCTSSARANTNWALGTGPNRTRCGVKGAKDA